MLGVHEQQHSAEQVLVHDVGLDVVRVVRHAEGQQLQDQSQQLSRLEVVCPEKMESFLTQYTHSNVL